MKYLILMVSLNLFGCATASVTSWERSDSQLTFQVCGADNDARMEAAQEKCDSPKEVGGSVEAGGTMIYSFGNGVYMPVQSRKHCSKYVCQL